MIWTRHRTIAWDEGIASERTVLAWERTAIATLALAVLVVRAGIVKSLLGLAIPLGALLVFAAIGEWLFSLRIYGEHDRPFEEGAVLHERAIATLAVITLIAAAGSAAVAILA
jgi:uncharacterized membrane protein YidH (DUF202 family)